MTIGPGGKITADVHAKYITIQGEVQGNVTAQEMVEIQSGGKLRGNIITPRVSILDGSFFKGSVEMEKTSSAAKQALPPLKETPQKEDESLLAKTKG